MEAQLLTEQLNRAIVSVFTSDDAKKLANIVLDWTKHVDNKYVRDILRALLRECERAGDKRKLRKILSNFSWRFPIPRKQIGGVGSCGRPLPRWAGVIGTRLRAAGLANTCLPCSKARPANRVSLRPGGKPAGGCEWTAKVAVLAEGFPGYVGADDQQTAR